MCLEAVGRSAPFPPFSRVQVYAIRVVNPPSIHMCVQCAPYKLERASSREYYELGCALSLISESRDAILRFSYRIVPDKYLVLRMGK